MATTYREMLERWAQRWITTASETIRQHQQSITELQTQIKSLTDVSERAELEDLIEELQSTIDGVRRYHRSWQRTAKRQWNLDMGELTV